MSASHLRHTPDGRNPPLPRSLSPSLARMRPPRPACARLKDHPAWSAAVLHATPTQNMNTFEEERIATAAIDKADFLKEESTINVLYWNGKAIDVQVPNVVVLKVTEAAPGAKGNTAQGRAEKPATLETGAIVNVPIFIEEGEMVRIDTDTKKYLGRSND